jgi:hypothetical protein
MIDEKGLVPPSVKVEEGHQVMMVVEEQGIRFYMGAIVRNGQWVSPNPEYRLPARLIGWTGIDNSWKQKPWLHR